MHSMCTSNEACTYAAQSKSGTIIEDAIWLQVRLCASELFGLVFDASIHVDRDVHRWKTGL